MFAPIRHIGWLLAVLCVIAQGCSPRVADEAKTVVAQADSMRAEGGMYNDSVQLAKTYRTLHRRKAFYSDEYARCCYHYGRLLREKDDPVVAMQVFINATHSHTRDYAILGRIYSNTGSICHLAGDYDLSYDMYERSGEMYLLAQDTLLYYYDLNNMAYELAEQGKKEETTSILSRIEANSTDENVINKTWETMAELFVRISQYDSVIYAVSYLENKGCAYSTHYVQKAQAYWSLDQKDSALYYAKYVIALPQASEQDKYNMLYIIANGDPTLSNDNILDISAQRSDIETEVLIPLHNQWALAVQLLKQDLNRHPDYQWIYVASATILVIGLILIIYIRRKRRRHSLLSQQIDDLTHANNAAMQLHEQIIQKHTEYTNSLLAQIEKNCTLMYHAENFPNNIYWKDFDAMSKLINDNFGMLVAKLQNTYHLSENGIRLCILVLLGNPNGKQLAHLLFYGESGIRNFKNRIANKLGTNSTELRTFLINLAIN